MGPVRYTISYTPLGDTRIEGEVKFYATDGRLYVIRTYDGMWIKCGNVVGKVWVRFKGIPTGSAVRGTIKP